MLSRLMLQEVREMLERHWSVYDIAHKLHIDTNLVTQAIEVLNRRTH